MSVVTQEPTTIERDVFQTTSFDGCGVLAEFPGPHELVSAASLMRQAGFSRTDAFSPFPIHGIDEALGIRATVLPWIVLCCGVAGGAAALLMQWWTNAVDYPFLISGKPLFSLPANIPVTFEVIILSSAFAAVFGMLILNGLPRLSNPLLDHNRFRRVTDDGFFHFVASDDPEFDHATVVSLYRRAAATRIDDVAESTSSNVIPWRFRAAAAVILTLALVPPVMIVWARNTTSKAPRHDFFADMDSQVTCGAQERSKLFADQRAMRPQVSGTIAVGDLAADDAFHRGIAAGEGKDEEVDTVVDEEADATKRSEEAVLTNGPIESAGPNYVTEFPLSVNEALMKRGRLQYNVYCAPCHGLAGQGDGLVSLRAIELQEPTWVPPTNLTNEIVSAQPVGKLIETISNGRRKMPGYAAQIELHDRWAIVLYLRALQRSENSTLDDVPADKAAILEAQR